jgi:peptide/nickel transport system permease protein
MLAGMVALGVLAAPGLMRIVRSATLPIRQELYIEAAEIAGLSRVYVLSRHVLPRIVGVVIVQASLLAAVALSVQTGLAFLNLLVASPAPSWGGMVADGTTVILSNPWLIWPPGVAIALTMLAFSVLGDALRDTATEPWSVVSRAPARSRKRNGAGAETRAHDALLSVEGLTVSIGSTRVLEDVGFELREREIVGIVGESGCGKTVTATALLGLVPGGGVIDEGAIWFAGHDLASDSEARLRQLRGREIAFISQESMIGLDPAFRVGAQVGEAVRTHLGLSRSDTRRRVLELLASVHFAEPELVARRYPHELSGGMAQRVAIARALAGEPKLLIADEPTTALDVTVQAEILALLRELREARGLSILLVTHDWGVVADACDRVVVMYAGEVVEQGDVESTFAHPCHPYTKALLASNPHHASLSARLPSIPGVVPSPGSWPAGCRFHARCPLGDAACVRGPVAIRSTADGRQVRCIHSAEVAAA